MPPEDRVFSISVSKSKKMYTGPALKAGHNTMYQYPGTINMTSLTQKCLVILVTKPLFIRGFALKGRHGEYEQGFAMPESP